MTSNSNSPLDLSSLAAAAQEGLDERVRLAVVRHMRAESNQPAMMLLAREVERLRWPAITAAAILVVTSAVVSQVWTGPSVPAVEPGQSVPTEWVERLERAGAIGTAGLGGAP